MSFKVTRYMMRLRPGTFFSRYTAFSIKRRLTDSNIYLFALIILTEGDMNRQSMVIPNVYFRDKLPIQKGVSTVYTGI